jgi:hypothetical protein
MNSENLKPLEFRELQTELKKGVAVLWQGIITIGEHCPGISFFPSIQKEAIYYCTILIHCISNGNGAELQYHTLPCQSLKIKKHNFCLLLLSILC